MHERARVLCRSGMPRRSRNNAAIRDGPPTQKQRGELNARPSQRSQHDGYEFDFDAVFVATMISLNATMKRFISSGVPTDTRK